MNFVTYKYIEFLVDNANRQVMKQIASCAAILTGNIKINVYTAQQIVVTDPSQIYERNTNGPTLDARNMTW